MVLENLIAYVVALGLPLWLVVEEIHHRAVPRREAEAAPALRQRAAEGASARAHVSAA